ncbi:probable MVD1 - mevalonate pyrophosphate decarboxylase [Melanopsichium pennsylvanicum]|uniref:Diphosphomevalonate decarboxylase n=2 Tax=Melanopsichium pennsylvanicum TaxID=63383 RepID=A0AAJ4XPE5_9BASI|nr:probable MVD1-mevalonate pyrophosphate decarboxylase [Melanopsichium pennsylvanicum 4]SNX84728.1 probable MVD1 - mevalonate pyrophosphate decarboxylase [Melanopsichium pennsylvanicum]
MPSNVHQATCSAPVNIAVIKYWGKKDTTLILPTNDSLSVTLDQDHLRSVTTARADASFSNGDRLWLNGEEETIKDGGRLHRCINEMKKLRQAKESEDASLAKLSEWPVHVCSENNFPTAAGLASSASGFAALIASLAALYELQPQVSSSQLSRIARQGSGSACRSLFGGYVAWQGGNSPTGQDSLAVQVAPQSHWPELQALICVVSDAKKGTPSTAGMQQTVATSPLLQHRINEVVPNRMKSISDAIQNKDFDTFADITMADSNNFHACCLDTSPPIFYMNDVSRAIVQLVEELNKASEQEGNGKLAAYTYDAGPNAVLYAPKQNIAKILATIRHYFPNADFDDTFGLLGKGANASHRGPQEALGLPSDLPASFNKNVILVHEAGAIRRLIHTQVGDGPRLLERGAGKESLLGENGEPLRLQRAKRA